METKMGKFVAQGTAKWLRAVLEKSSIELGHTQKTKRPAAWLFVDTGAMYDGSPFYRKVVAIYDDFGYLNGPGVKTYPFPDDLGFASTFNGVLLTDAASNLLAEVGKKAGEKLQKWLDENDKVDNNEDLLFSIVRDDKYID